MSVACSTPLRFSLHNTTAAPRSLLASASPPPTTSDPNPDLDSPIWGNGDFSKIKCFYRKKDTIYILETMHSLTDFFLATPSTTRLSKRQKKRKQLIPKTQLISTSSTSTSTSLSQPNSKDSKNYHPQEIRVFDTLHFASQIYQRALSIPPILFTSSQNNQDIEELYEAMGESVSDVFWKRYPGIWMWVLCVGLAASVERMERPYWMHLLSKILFYFSDQDVAWLESRCALDKFLLVQERIRRDG